MDDPGDEVVVATYRARCDDGVSYHARYDDVATCRARHHGGYAATVRAGIDRWVFAAAAPEVVARSVATATSGARTGEVAFGERVAQTRAPVESSPETEFAISVDRGVPA